MVSFRYIVRLLLLPGILFLQGPVTAGGLQEAKEIHITYDLTSGEVLFQASGPDVSGKNINLYRELRGFHTTSVRSTNKNGEQYTELVFQADNFDDPMLPEQVFTHLLSRKCTLRYDRDNDTLNLVINNAAGIQINFHNGRDLLRPVDKNVPMLMLVWPGETEIFEVDASLNE